MIEGLEEALEIVQKYQNRWWRRIGINVIASDLKEIIQERINKEKLK